MSALAYPIAGTRLVKGPLLLPQTTTGTLFTVAGTVVVTGLFGICTAVSTGGGQTYTLGPNLGNVTLAGLPVVGQVLIPFGVTLNATQCLLMSPMSLGDGGLMRTVVTANITLQTSANVNASFQWYCWWMPLTAGSSVS